MTWECKPEFPLLLLLLSHLIQAGTWTKVSSSIKMQRHYKGRKSAACMHSWDKLWATRYKMIKPQLPLLRCWGQKQGSECKPTHSTTKGVGRPRKPRLVPHPRIHPTLTPHKGPACSPWDRARELVSLPSNCSKNSNETERDPTVLAPPCPQPAFCPRKALATH